VRSRCGEQRLPDARDCVRERLEVDPSLGLADQVAEKRGVPTVAALVSGDACKIEQAVDRDLVEVELWGRQPGCIGERVACTRQPGIESRLR
jgi:hypothetical protein